MPNHHTQTQVDERLREIGDRPGDDVLERLQHTVRVFQTSDRDYSDQVAVMATSGAYAPGIWTGLTYGDLTKLETRIREDERTRLASVLEDSVQGEHVCGGFEADVANWLRRGGE